MARPSDREKIEEIGGWIRDDERWRKQWADYESWELYENYYRHEFQGEGLIPLNIFYPLLGGLIPQVYYQNPGVLLQSRMGPGGETKAKVATAVVNWLMRTLDLAGEARDASKDCFLCGAGFLTHGYDSRFGFVEGEGNTQVVDEEKIEYHEKVQPGMPWTLRDHPEDVLLPWGSVSQSGLRRVIFRRLRLLEDVESDPKYSNSAKKELEPAKPKDWGGAEELHEDWVFIYEVHDMKDGQVKVISGGEPSHFLRKERSRLLEVFDGVPVTVLNWNKNQRSVWGTPDAKYIHQLQENLNNVNTMITEDLRKRVAHFFYDRERLEPSELDKLTREKQKTGIPVEGSPRDSVLPFQISHDPLLWNDLQQLARQARLAIGIPVTRTGGITPPSKRTTKGEIARAEFGGSLRLGPKRLAVKRAIEDVAKKWLRLVSTFWDEERMVHAPEINGPYEWVLFKGTDLGMKYDFEVNPEEAAMPTHAGRKQEATTLGPTLIEASQLEGVNGREIVRQVLQRFPGWNANRIVPPQRRGRGGGVVRLTENGELQPLKERRT